MDTNTVAASQQAHSETLKAKQSAARKPADPRIAKAQRELDSIVERNPHLVMKTAIADGGAPKIPLKALPSNEDVATEDVIVDPPKSTAASRKALKVAALAFKITDDEAEKLARKAAAPKAARTTAAAPKAKAAPKATAKTKALVVRVPAAEMEALLADTGLSKSQLAKAAAVSPSLVSEWVGMGRGQLMNRDRFAAVAKAAKGYAKGLK